MQAQEEKETEMMTTSSSASESDEETLAAMATAVKENQEKGKGGADKGEEEVREEKRSRNKEPRISTCFSTSRMKRLIRSCVPDYRITPDAIFLFNKASEPQTFYFTNRGLRTCVKNFGTLLPLVGVAGFQSKSCSGISKCIICCLFLYHDSMQYPYRNYFLNYLLKMHMLLQCKNIKDLLIMGAYHQLFITRRDTSSFQAIPSGNFSQFLHSFYDVYFVATVEPMTNLHPNPYFVDFVPEKVRAKDALSAKALTER